MAYLDETGLDHLWSKIKALYSGGSIAVCSAHRGSNFTQTYPTASSPSAFSVNVIDVNTDADVFELGTCPTTGKGGIKVKKSGVYEITGQYYIEFSSLTSSNYAVGIYPFVNGSEAGGSLYPYRDQHGMLMPVLPPKVIRLSAGDVVTLALRATRWDSGNMSYTVYGDGTGKTFLALKRLGD